MSAIAIVLNHANRGAGQDPVRAGWCVAVLAGLLLAVFFPIVLAIALAQSPGLGRDARP
jgi:hypothetical protein